MRLVREQNHYHNNRSGNFQKKIIYHKLHIIYLDFKKVVKKMIRLIIL